MSFNLLQTESQLPAGFISITNQKNLERNEKVNITIFTVLIAQQISVARSAIHTIYVQHECY